MIGHVVMDPDEDAPRRPLIGGDTIGATEIATWIDGDVGPRGKWPDQLIAKLQEVAREQTRGVYLGCGNAHHIYAHAGHVYVDCEYDETAKVLMTSEQALAAIARFHRFYDGDRQPESFALEYEAEGDDAEQRFLALTGYRDLGELPDGWD